MGTNRSRVLLDRNYITPWFDIHLILSVMHEELAKTEHPQLLCKSRYVRRLIVSTVRGLPSRLSFCTLTRNSATAGGPSSAPKALSSKPASRPAALSPCRPAVQLTRLAAQKISSDGCYNNKERHCASLRWYSTNIHTNNPVRQTIHPWAKTTTVHTTLS